MILQNDKEDGKAAAERTYEVEYDWIGIGKQGKLGIFSSFCPNCLQATWSII
jgi:hypothetical protein